MSQRTSPRRSSARGVEQANLPLGMVGAVALHVAILAATMFAWTHTLDIADEAPPVVPVDLVTIGEKTNIRAMVKQQPKEPPKQEEVQPPSPEKAEVTPVTPQREEAAPPPDQMAAEKVPQKPPPPPQVQPQEKPQPEKKKESFDIDKMMAFLDKRAPAQSAAPNAAKGPKTIKGIGQQNAMTMDLIDTLRNQIAQCWSPPVGAPHPEQLIVQYELFLNRDGTVAQTPQLLSSTSSDPFMRAAADAARRAIYTCQPYRLPPDRYDQWQDITLNFDPRQMVGQ
ncbi:MAG: hypothetical protein JOZ72_01340 [Alphaproteobacteria bacterium]|nr:hypothetical protein [Alphaproteobacteria bacterium]